MKIKKIIKKNEITFSWLFLILAIICFLLLFLAKEPDYYWHIKVGEYIFKHGLLKKDIFSWIIKGKYWMSHEWLSELFLYTLKVVFKNYHLVVFTIINFICLYSLLFFTNKNNYIKNSLFSILWLTCSTVFVPYVQARPHLISYNLLTLTIWILYDLYKNEKSKKIYFLPIITILWANCHGGSSNLPYLFCLLFIIGGLCSFEFGKIKATKMTKKQLYKYFFIMILCICCVCINIHGVKMLLYPYENMANKLMINSIAEWRITSLNEVSHYPYFVFILLIISILLISNKKIDIIDFLLILVGIYLGLKAIRFWPYIYIISNFVIFNYVEKFDDLKISHWAIVITGCLFLAFFLAKANSIPKNMNSHLVDENVIHLLKEEQPKRLFNMYDYGGELIYNGIEVFVDGRADLYSKYNYEDFLDICNLRGNYVDTINKYNFDYLLVNNSYPIFAYLVYNENYTIIYSDSKMSLFKKSS